jgi:hypothetical protein
MDLQVPCICVFIVCKGGSVYSQAVLNNMFLCLFSLTFYSSVEDCLCGLVVRIAGYRLRGFGFDSWRYQIF